MEEKALIYRNKIMFYVILVYGFLVTVSMLLSKKPLAFVIPLTMVNIICLVIYFFVVYKTKINPIIPAMYTITAFIGVTFLAFIKEPSLNKFLFFFLTLNFSIIYQRTIIIIYSGVISVAITAYCYFNYKEEIFGGYEIVEIKSLIYSIFIMSMISLFMVMQTKSSEKLRKEANETAKKEKQSKEKMNQTLEKLQENRKELNVFSGKLNENIHETQTTSKNFIEGFSQMEESIKATNENLMDITDNTQKMDEGVEDLHNQNTIIQKLSSESKNVVDNAGENVETLIDSITILKKEMDENNQLSTTLNDKSNMIGTIIETIEDIARNINLLSLNAAIEAQRAGEQGKGFGVVASEIKKLSHLTNDSTKDISKILSDLKETSNSMKGKISKSEDSIIKSQDSTNHVQEAFNNIKTNNESLFVTLDEMVNRINTIKGMSNNITLSISSISTYSEENTASITQLSGSIEEMNSMIDKISNDFEDLNEKMSFKE